MEVRALVGKIWTAVSDEGSRVVFPLNEPRYVANCRTDGFRVECRPKPPKIN